MKKRGSAFADMEKYFCLLNMFLLYLLQSQKADEIHKILTSFGYFDDLCDVGKLRFIQQHVKCFGSAEVINKIINCYSNKFLS